MPELPEVEVTRRGIAPRLEGRRATGAVARTPMLRYPIPADLDRRKVEYFLRWVDTGRLPGGGR